MPKTRRSQRGRGSGIGGGSMTGPMARSSSNVGTDEHNAVESSNVGHDQ